MTVMEDLLAKDSQASFRVSSHRMTNGIDNAPMEEDIQLYDLLLAEAEQMVTNHEAFGSTATTSNTTGKPTIKAVQGSPGNSKQRDTTCHWWGTEGGCRQGKSASLLMIGKQSKTRPIAVGCVPAQPTAKQSVPHHLLARPISCQQQLGGVGQQVAVGAEKGDKITQREKGGAKASQRAKEKPPHHKAAHQAVVR